MTTRATVGTGVEAEAQRSVILKVPVDKVGTHQTPGLLDGSIAYGNVVEANRLDRKSLAIEKDGTAPNPVVQSDSTPIVRRAVVELE